LFTLKRRLRRLIGTKSERKFILIKPFPTQMWTLQIQRTVSLHFPSLLVLHTNAERIGQIYTSIQNREIQIYFDTALSIMTFHLQYDVSG
jgi:hypothetical protein